MTPSTDSLAKFIATWGILILILSYIYPEYLLRIARHEWFPLDERIKILQNRLEFYQSRVKEGHEHNEDEVQGMKEETIRCEVAQNKLLYLVKEIEQMRRLRTIGMTIGLTLTIIGIVLWAGREYSTSDAKPIGNSTGYLVPNN